MRELMNLTKWQFLIGTLSLAGSVTLLGYLTGTHVIKFPFPDFAIIAVAVQWLLVRLRERCIRPKFSWRSWYTGILAAIAITVIYLIWVPPDDRDAIRYVSQVILFYVFVFYLLIAPVVVAGFSDKKPD